MKELIGKYERVQIIPMNNNKNEPRVEGKSKDEVKREYFEKEIKVRRIYYYHKNMIDIQNCNNILVLFQYCNAIIACGIVGERIKVNEDGYIEPNHNFKYDGMLKLEEGTICTVDDITNDELNKVLDKDVIFSNAFHILKPKTDEFHELLKSKTYHKEY